MTRHPAFTALTALCVGILTLLSGCSVIPEAKPDPTRFFVLEDPAATVAPAAPNADAVTIGLLPIEVPAYLLDTRAIAVAATDSQITFRDFDRWAEPLDKGLARVLRGALARQASVERVLVPPFPLQPARDYDLSVRVVDCVGLESGRLRYVLSYALTAPDGSLHRQGTYVWQGAGESSDSAQLARTISAATMEAGREIAAAATP